MFLSKSKQIIFLAIFTVSLCGLFFPWFIVMPGVTDYYLGIYGIRFEALQIIIIYFMCIMNFKNSIAKLVMVVLLISIPVSYFIQWYQWYLVNLGTEIEKYYVLLTTRYTFGIALFLTIIPIMCFPLLCKKGGRNIRENCSF